MRYLLFLLIPAALFGGQPRYARLGEFEGKVEIQLTAADTWLDAQRNLPLLESSWLRTASASKVEVEFDDGGAFRLGPDSLAEISDLARLSTSQRITLISLDRGIAYFTGQPESKDALTLAVPGAQVTLRRGARVRLEATPDWSQVAVIEGAVRFSSPAAEFDLTEGQTARVEPARTSRFFLYREITEAETDRWNEQRDKFLASSVSGRHVPAGYGLADMDANGEWVQSQELGAVWKPKVAEGWVPYRNGRWHWYDTLGYTWIAAEPWGWTPYHYGRFLRHDSMGWIWVPAKSATFKPGDTYWLRGAKIAGWGPLAPGEDWSPTAQPRQFLNVHTTWADFLPDARIIDPAGFTARPREALGVAAFALALPSPAFPAARLDVPRPVLRVGSTRVVPVLPGVTYQNPNEVASSPAGSPSDPSASQPVAVVTNPASADTPVVIVDQPPPPPQVIEYPVPVYTGIVVVNPPERGERRRRERPNSPSSNPPAPTATPTKSVVNREPEKQSPSRQSVTPVQAVTPPVRSEPVREHRERPAPAPTPAAAPPQTPAPAPVRSAPVREHRERPAPPPEKAPDKPAEKTVDKTPDKPADPPPSSVIRRR